MGDERGFSLIEIVVAVAIAVMLLAAGGVWLLGMHPGALRQAAGDFDADLDAARALASTSGNGATIAFLPRQGKPGFELRVYSGRPTVADAVKPSNVMILYSAATVNEATFGAPPFALFLSSAGYPTGVASYPNVAANGTVSFPVIATQPPCPSSGLLTLTFSDAQHASVVRTLRCDVMVTGVAQPMVTPTPNVPRLSPASVVAHWTGDAYNLRFTAAEYGYFSWYASGSGATCETQGSDTGAAPAVFPSPWPYLAAQATTPASPAPPNAPYTYTDLSIPDDPPAHFALQPVAHNGGTCVLHIVDGNGQPMQAQIQVMGDLTPSATSLTFDMNNPVAQNLTLTKTWDSEPIVIAYGGNCANIVAVAPRGVSTPPQPGTTPASVTWAVTPTAAGSCTMQFTDQYREPWVTVLVNVKSSKFKTWPAHLILGANGVAIAQASGVQVAMTPQAHVAQILNAIMGGGNAIAGGYTGPCYALAQASATSAAPDTNNPKLSTYLAQLGIQIDSSGCELNATGSAPYGESSPGVGTPTGVMIAYEPGGQPGTFSPYNNTCGGSGFASIGSWYPNLGRNDIQASLTATGTAAGSCVVDISDGNTTSTPPPPAPDAGQVAVDVAVPCSFANGVCTAPPMTDNGSGCVEGASGSDPGIVEFFSSSPTSNTPPSSITGSYINGETYTRGDTATTYLLQESATISWSEPVGRPCAVHVSLNGSPTIVETIPYIP